MKKILITMLCIYVTANCHAQNNPFIFFGGSGDGNKVFSYAQLSVETLNRGGNGDGFATNNYVQATDSTLNRGGQGDGFATNNYVQATDSTLNRGGQGDGFATNNYVQATDSTLNRGGQGDGWANIYYPLNPLPLNLLAFTGKKVNEGHLLQWQTANEINVSHFYLERATDARNFRFINKQDAKGNGTAQSYLYSYIDAAPVFGDNYYRLRIIDLDGSEKISNIVLLRVSGNGQTVFSIFPNPTANLLNIKISGIEPTEKMILTITDSKGSLVYKKPATSDQQIQIFVQSLAKGAYILTLHYGNKQEHIRFIKQ